MPVEPLDVGDEAIIEKVSSVAADCDLLVDGLFGTGLVGQLRPEYVRLIDAVNARNQPIIAVDIPSGLDCDTGLPLATAIKADATVTFVAVKKGFTQTEDARQYTGRIYVASIGVEPDFQEDK